MADILDRLRDADTNRERYVMGGPRAILPLLRDAADEIERLRDHQAEGKEKMSESENKKDPEQHPSPWQPIPRPHIMQFFAYEHLPTPLQEVSKPFCEIAKLMLETLPSNPERSAGLRKLLEAKDCAVRAKLSKNP